MLSGLHSKKSSQETRGTSYQHILEHILQYPGSYDIPLRTMYAINASPFQQMHSTGPNTGSSATAAAPTSPHKSGRRPGSTREMTAQFTSSLIDQISNLPSQPCSLPTNFMTSFLRRCFTIELELVDFPQALTGLDYLKDLETRRRREVEAAMQRLGTNRAIIGTTSDPVSEKYPAVAMWGIGMKGSEKRAEALYTQLFVALRRWILINEYSLEPFNRTNCITMLNTLYPHVSSSQPMPGLTPETLRKQRDIFFQYIAAVEKRGRGVLTVLMLQGKADGDETGWQAARATLEKYLRITQSLIDECSQITGVDYFHSGATRDSSDSGKQQRERRKNEGSRHGSIGRLETTPSHTVDSHNRADARSPVADDAKSLSTLEKLAKELRRIKARSRPEQEIHYNTQHTLNHNNYINHSNNGGMIASPTMPDNGAAHDQDGSSSARRFFKRMRSPSITSNKTARARSESVMSFRTTDSMASAHHSRLPSLDSPLHRSRFLSAASNTDTIRLR